MLESKGTVGSESGRSYWLCQLQAVAKPVLQALNERMLKARMPVECVEGCQEDRALYTHLEALGRLLCGIAPWLDNDRVPADEEELRRKYAELARGAIDAATDPNSVDYMNFSEGYQPIVDAAFLAQALLRAPNELWVKLDDRVRSNVVSALRATRTRKPHYNNWLLFGATIEAALHMAGESDWDPMRIDYALKQHAGWYAGDGAYGDGPEFHWDYYNSFVIIPMLVDVLRTVGNEYGDWSSMREGVMKHAIRYAAVQERFIAPDGSFPPIGRSLAYRSGAFQSLAQIALLDMLPEGLEPAAVRCALAAVIRRTLEAQGTFTTEGWLRIGLSGHQPGLGEAYISTGSLYLCAAVFLPLGLPPEHPFWSGADREWTSRLAWGGSPIPIDSAWKG
ncbi:DUF2264 domain-containing protein [Paenibacillus chungangensis]|uniref:DUF2264 domain-containing protein n=1 Tax=Paenibacillus chungangensis TaxID=696535 RepID=A0ABW3HU08_9BACL